MSAHLMWILVYIPLALWINGAILIAILGKLRNTKLEFVVLGDSSISYETFVALTYDLENVRKNVKAVDVSELDKTETINEIDNKLNNLQKTLIKINTGGIPNPDMLTKRYLQELILQTMLLRIEFEKIGGRFIENQDASTVNVVKLSSRI